MRALDAFRARLSHLFRSRAEARMEEEFRFHVEMETEANLRKGLEPEEARRRALVVFGGMDRQRERMREGRFGHAVELVARDLRHAARALHRASAYSTAVVLTLGMGIGAVTALFTLVDHILIRPLPYPDADRLVEVAHAAPGLGLARTGLSSGTYFHYRARSSALSSLAVFTEAIVNVSGGDETAERVELAMVSPEFFEVMGVEPLIGHTFTPEEIAAEDGMNMTGQIPILLSHDLWQRRFASDSAIVGRTIDINTRARRVVGVMPPGFDFPRESTQVWMLSVVPERTANLGRGLDYDAVARLGPGVSAEQARAELARVLRSVVGTLPDATPQRFAELGLEPLVAPLKSCIVGRVESALWILLGSMALLLLAASANVANLSLARSHQRLPEVSLRSALGGGRADVARVYLSESFLLGSVGAGLGLLLAAGGLSVLVAFAPVELPRMDEVHLDLRTYALASALGLATALFVGLVPILKHARSLDAATPLRKQGRGNGSDRESRRLRGFLVAAQVTLAFTLLLGSLLTGRSFARLMNVDPGFDPEGVLVVEMGLPHSRASRHHEIFTSLVDRLRALPGVAGVAGTSDLPLNETVWSDALAAPLRVPGSVDVSAEIASPVAIHFFLPGYFEVMRTPVIEGSALGATEPPPGRHPVVINTALARRLFGERSALGQRIRRLGDDGGELDYGSASCARPGSECGPDGVLRQPDYVVTGVVADVRATSLRDAPAEVVYIPVLDLPVDPGFVPTEMTFVIRTSVPPLSLATAVRDIVREIDPVLGVTRVRTLDQVVATSIARERFLAALLRVAGAASLLLGAIGIYGVVGYSVRQRTREMGIRVALGAEPGEVVQGVLRDSLPMVLAGAAAGVIASLFATRLLKSLLFGVQPEDPVALAQVALLVLAVSTVAIWIPAHRASRTDPVEALRAEV